ncbi:MAG TPA: indole-3-glycerol phosphate synthase TrpC [Usitatibacter sp.]|nr:indole-3-glycerol phosphate synthase TrpC [Usitatibacter sp.]
MAHVLDRILAAKRREVEEARGRVPLGEVERRAAKALPVRGFEQRLRAQIESGRVAVIAEIKRASPSKGLIRADFDPARIARSYEAHGASCLSVLTDREFFGGSAEDLMAARAACAIPVLRKDFIIDPYQVFEARSWGADCVLLIIDAAPDGQLRELESLARRLGMDTLVESHDAEQLERALSFATSLIGINNRDLRTFETRLETTLDLVGRVIPPRILVTESGIGAPADVERLRKAKVSAYLVGGALMAAKDPGKELERVFSAFQ